MAARKSGKAKAKQKAAAKPRSAKKKTAKKGARKKTTSKKGPKTPARAKARKTPKKKAAAAKKAPKKPAKKATKKKAKKPGKKTAKAGKRPDTSAAVAAVQDRLTRTEGALRAARRSRTIAESRVSELEQALTAAVAQQRTLKEQLETSSTAPPPTPPPSMEQGDRAAELEQRLEAARRSWAERVKELEQQLSAEGARHSAVTRRAASLETELGEAHAETSRARETLSRTSRETGQLKIALAAVQKELDETRNLEGHLGDDARKDGHTGPLLCPRCRATMIEFDHLGITLDRCTGCSGLYFDAGELEEVLAREFPETMVQEAEAYAGEIAISGVGPEGDTVPDIDAVRKSGVGGFFKTLFSRRRHEAAADADD